jgi:hypothetical protein
MPSCRCAIEGCSKWVVFGEKQCSAHSNSETAPAPAPAPSPLDDVSREASADAQDGSSASRRKGSSAFAKSVPRRSSIVDAEVRQQGYLDKASSGAFRQHQSRYFVAAGHYLKYYESSERCGPDDDVKGCLDLRDVLSVEADGKTLTIVCGGGGKALELVARSSENAAVWKEAIEAGRAADTDSYGRKYSARPAPPAAAVAAGAAQLVTREEAVQQIEAALGQPVLRARLKLVQQAFTRTGGGGDEARNLDLAAVQRSGFDNYLTDTVSRRFRAGQAVLLASPDGKTAAALGKPHGVPRSVLPSFTMDSLAHYNNPSASLSPTTQASSAPSPLKKPAAGSSTPSWPSATAASARLSWSTRAYPPLSWR